MVTDLERREAFKLVVLAGKLHSVGGVETHLYHYAKQMVEKTSDLEFIVTSKGLKREYVDVLEESGVHVSEFDCTGRTAVISYARCLRFLRKLSHDRVMLYSNGRSGFAYLAATVLKPCIWIHHHHSDVSTALIEEFSRLYRRVLRQCDWLIACTPGHAKLLGHSFRRLGKTISLPYLLAEPNPGSEYSRVRPRERRGGLVVGFFGRLRVSKGILTLLGLAPWFEEQGIECRLHGDDCEELLSDGLPPAVTWAGAYDAAKDMDRLLEDVDFVVLPTTFAEGLPIVMTEAISRGVPVVAYDGGGLREMSDFHRGVLVVPPDVERLKAAVIKMKEIIRDPALSESLKQCYKRSFSAETTIKWWSAMFDS